MNIPEGQGYVKTYYTYEAKANGFGLGKWDVNNRLEVHEIFWTVLS